MTRIETNAFSLHGWQEDAVDAWAVGVDGRSFRGTLEVVTGGGKTLIALACLARAAATEPELKVAVVVPTEALARQWERQILEHTSLTSDEIGRLGGGRRDTLENRRALVCVINSAAEHLPQLAASQQPLMLIVDECHRAGAPRHSRVLTTPSAYRLGLSATPDREELTEEGEPLDYDEQAVGRALGGVVYRFTLKDARNAGWLPEFTLHHHGIELSPSERREYDVVSRRVDEAGDTLRGHGVESSRARTMVSRRDEVGDAARQWVQLTARRKDLLYRAEERHRVVVEVMRRVLDPDTSDTNEQRRVILFHERVDEAARLHEALTTAFPGLHIVLEHSRLKDRERQQALSAFATGAAPVLVSVKSLVEGIDVPEADTGVSVASTSAVRQRVQSLGRVLRRAVTADGREKESRMHLVYVADTVDDLIYAKADWSDLTGEDANVYWRWEYAGDRPYRVQTPPRTPLPTEDQAWEQLGRRIGATPVRWPGVVDGREYSVKTNGAVHNEFGNQISNPQDVAEMVRRVRGREGGRFRVTPEHRLVLVWDTQGEDSAFYVAGRLTDSFRVLEDQEAFEPTGTGEMQPGDDLPGTGDKAGGSFKVSQRAGGLIERRVKDGSETAVSGGSGNAAGEANVRRVLAAWEQLDRGFSRFFVTSAGDAWYEGPTGRKFIARVPGGFAWIE